PLGCTEQLQGMALPAANLKFERFKKLLFLCLGDDEISEQGIESLRVYLEGSCPIYEQKIDMCRRFVALAIPKIPEGMLKDFATRFADLLEDLVDNEELQNANLEHFVKEIRRCYPGKSAEVCRFIMNHVLGLRNQDAQAHLPEPKVDRNISSSSTSAAAPVQYPQAVPEEYEEGEITTTSTRTRRQPEITNHADAALQNDDTMSQNFSTISLHNQPPNTDYDTNVADPRMRSQSLTRHRRQAEDWASTTMPATVPSIQPKSHGASKTGQPGITQAYAAPPRDTAQDSLDLPRSGDDLSTFAVNPYIPRPGQLCAGGASQSQNAKATFGSFRDCPPLSNATRASKTKQLASQATSEFRHASNKNTKGTKDAKFATFGRQPEKPVELFPIHHGDSKTSQSGGPGKSFATTNQNEIKENSITQTYMPVQDAVVSSCSQFNAIKKIPLLKEEPNDDVSRLSPIGRDTATTNTRKRSNDDEVDGNKRQKIAEYHPMDSEKRRGQGQGNRPRRRPAPVARKIDRQHPFPKEIYDGLTRNPYLVFEDACPFALTNAPCPWGEHCRLLRDIKHKRYKPASSAFAAFVVTAMTVTEATLTWRRGER
ncbi:MAG: hypothetical protein Q9184_007814, partial [Pyrenodesmia sp. 2 TL-2023]